jgi:FAD/FMN-containing dehydrogenase
MATDVSSAAQDARGSFVGALIEPGDASYDDVRAVHNGLIDKRPALIARCRGMADIADAVRLGRQLGLEIAVRGGGHNIGGRGTVDGGLMIDLSLMQSVHVDPRARTVRVEGGTLWKGVNRETQAHGLATTGGIIGTTGVGGLTLGGGFGWLMPKHGMALDNLLAVDLVLADGSIVRASATDHPDLFWAVRGGGGNFGVAGSFEFRLHQVGPIVTGGLVAWPIAQARDMLRFFRDLSQSIPDDMMMVAAMLTAPDGVTKIAAMAAGHFGDSQAGAAAVDPIKRFGSPIMDMLGPIPYTQLNSMLDASFPKGALNYWKSHFVDTLSDEAIDALIESATSCPTPMGQVLLEHFHGAVARVPVDQTAYALRRTGYNALLLAEWTDQSQNDRCIGWARDRYTAIEPFVGERRYLNYLGTDEDADRALAAAYGPNLSRLRQIKRQYDPDNVFHLNVNIPPA